MISAIVEHLEQGPEHRLEVRYSHGRTLIPPALTPRCSRFGKDVRMSNELTGGIVRLPKVPPPSTSAVRAAMQGNRGMDTRPELALRSELHRRGNRFRKAAAPVKGLRCRADIVFVRARVAVFVDGCFWHRCPEHGTSPRTNSEYWQVKLDRNVARDRRNDDALMASGWAVVRVWEHEDVADAASRVEAILGSRAPLEPSTYARICSRRRGQMSSAPRVGRDETAMHGLDD